jgi:hypothetical protein
LFDALKVATKVEHTHIAVSNHEQFVNL